LYSFTNYSDLLPWYIGVCGHPAWRKSADESKKHCFLWLDIAVVGMGQRLIALEAATAPPFPSLQILASVANRDVQPAPITSSRYECKQATCIVNTHGLSSHGDWHLQQSCVG